MRTLLFSATLLSALAVAATGAATTLMPTSFAEIARQADFIIQGIVAPGSRRIEQRDGIPWTCVSIAVSRVIKGTPQPVPTLCFVGGAGNGSVLNVPGVSPPIEGREAVFFYYDQSRNFINPLAGWSQGLFYVNRDGGTETISTADGAPIADLKIDAGPASRASTAAAGVILAEGGTSLARATTGRLIEMVHKALVSQ